VFYALLQLRFWLEKRKTQLTCRLTNTYVCRREILVMTQKTSSKMLQGMLLVAVLVLTSACGMLSTLTGGGSGTATNSLWADVPQLDGATKTSTELPLPVRLIAQQMLGGKFGFVSYKTTKSADDIKTFYSTETMQGLGWQADSGGCNAISADTSGGNNPAGGFCTFTRTDAGKQTVLLIMLGQADDSKDTQLFYVRAELPPTAKP
jgi:hypothetical protein